MSNLLPIALVNSKPLDFLSRWIIIKPVLSSKIYPTQIFGIIQNMHKIFRLFCLFSTKSTNFFLNQVNPGVKNVRYAVRGIVATMADHMKNELKSGNHSYPFNEVTYCNIGNPQEFNQKPITFFREVIACVVCPQLINDNSINPDARKRAKRYLEQIVSSGAYTHSLGIRSIRENVAKFIAKRDLCPQPQIDEIFMTDGASQGVHILFSSIICNKKDSILVPIPIYPLYTASISLYGGSPAPYYLDENDSWGFSTEQLDRAIEKSRAKGHIVKAIVVINPGNPTGSVLSVQTIKTIIEFAVKNELVILADEVYRQNVYRSDATFYSFRRVLETMPPEYRDKCELASMYSTSKGLMGQCGFRGGYFYLHNFDPFVVDQMAKLKTVNLCSSSLGQIMVDCMVNPPLEGVSKQTKKQYLDETKAIYKSLKQRAKIVTKYLNSMTNIKSNRIDGAMYAFPSIKFSRKAQIAAQKEGRLVDQFYCVQVLRNTGIALIAGSGFSQYPGTHHFRVTILILPEEKLKQKMEVLKKFNQQFHAKYAD